MTAGDELSARRSAKATPGPQRSVEAYDYPLQISMVAPRYAREADHPDPARWGWLWAGEINGGLTMTVGVLGEGAWPISLDVSQAQQLVATLNRILPLLKDPA